MVHNRVKGYGLHLDPLKYVSKKMPKTMRNSQKGLYSAYFWGTGVGNFNSDPTLPSDLGSLVEA